MKTMAELARAAGVSKALLRKLLRQGRLVDATGVPVTPTKVAQTLLFPDDTTWDRTRAPRGSLTPEQRYPWKGAKK